MTATYTREPAPLLVQEAAFAQLQAGLAEHHMQMIPTSDRIKVAIFHTRRAVKCGADQDAAFDALEAWIPEGLS